MAKNNNNPKDSIRHSNMATMLTNYQISEAWANHAKPEFTCYVCGTCSKKCKYSGSHWTWILSRRATKHYTGSSFFMWFHFNAPWKFTPFRIYAMSMSTSKCGSSPHGPIAHRPSQALCAPSLDPSHKSPVLLKNFQMALRLRALTFSESKKKDPR
jgi:hypothetical protein